MKSDTQFQIGKILKSDEGQRDAIHLAVFPAFVTDNYISPGSHVKLLFGTTDQLILCVNDADRGIGIIDPFLTRSPQKGQRVWVFLNPNTVTGMRHDFSHPALDHPGEHHPSEVWLRQFADRWGMDYDEMISIALKGPAPEDEWGDAIVAHGRDLHSATELDGEDVPFWQHLALLTGRSFSQEHLEGIIWSCSC